MSGPSRSTPDDRAERLAQQLRENLRRRKAQARDMKNEVRPGSDTPEAQDQ